MLKIELSCVEPGVCPDCLNTGVVVLGKTKMVAEPGTFCHCDAGAKKWEATLRMKSDADEGLTGPLEQRRPREATLGLYY